MSVKTSRGQHGGERNLRIFLNFIAFSTFTSVSVTVLALALASGSAQAAFVLTFDDPHTP